MSMMMDILKRLEAGGKNAIPEVIKDLVVDNQFRHDRMISNYKRYKASSDPDGVPVFSRRFDNPDKVNRKINTRLTPT